MVLGKALRLLLFGEHLVPQSGLVRGQMCQELTGEPAMLVDLVALEFFVLVLKVLQLHALLIHRPEIQFWGIFSQTYFCVGVLL